MRAVRQGDVGRADADARAVAEGSVVGLGPAVALDGLDLEADPDPAAEPVGVGGREVAQDAVADLPALDRDRDVLDHLERGAGPDRDGIVEAGDPLLGRGGCRDEGGQRARGATARISGRTRPGGAAREASSVSKNSASLKPKPPATRLLGEGLDQRVQVPRGAVVVAPGHLELVLDLRELALELAEVGVGLELGIGLGERHQAPERTLEPPLGLALLAGGLGGQARWREAAISSNRPRSCAA